MCTLWTSLLNLSIPDVPFSVLLSTLIRSRFQAKPATLLIPIEFPFLFAVEELYGTRYQSGSFSLINVGSGFHCLRSFFSFLFFSRYIENLLRWQTVNQLTACHTMWRSNVALPSSPWVIHSGVQLTRLICLLWLSIRLFDCLRFLPFHHSFITSYSFS
jgi:hypothetical protein